jgi:trk system potassium uptake protein TrkH
MRINLKAVAGVLGALLTFIGVALLVPMVIGIGFGESEAWPAYGISALLAICIGGVAWYFWKPREELGIREGFAIVALAWIVVSAVGALPFTLSGALTSYTDAFFETMSGFTTTGATIMGGNGNPAIENLAYAHLFWRSLAHWLGGMGIIVLTLAVLPMLGVGGMQLFRAEAPGPSADKFTPRVKETAKRLWLIYAGITFLQVLLLLPAMGTFDAVNHTFATMATGGFSTKNGSVADFHSPYVEWVIIVFMFLAGMNFVLHYRMLRGKQITVVKDEEFRLYTAIILLGIAVVTLAIWEPTASLVHPISGSFESVSHYSNFGEAIRKGAFQVMSIVTTTGFGTADYEFWPPLAIVMLFGLFFAGGMAGSTAGSIKSVRHLLLIKNTLKEFRQLVHPRALIPVRMNGAVVSDDVMRNVLAFFVMYIAFIGIGTFVIALLGFDLVSAMTGTMSCLGNIGPAFGSFGPTDNYAHLPWLGKWLLAMFMMIGRLEIFTVIVIILPVFWKR